ncbi:hypothetical protein C8R45DRAFT_947781 [Mycena sanguinolenta]|nr:hypothetical protein C8R45DRAFT_947781 [Mycena sanguinolenta]
MESRGERARLATYLLPGLSTVARIHGVESSSLPIFQINLLNAHACPISQWPGVICWYRRSTLRSCVKKPENNMHALIEDSVLDLLEQAWWIGKTPRLGYAPISGYALARRLDMAKSSEAFNTVNIDVDSYDGSRTKSQKDGDPEPKRNGHTSVHFLRATNDSLSPPANHDTGHRPLEETSNPNRFGDPPEQKMYSHDSRMLRLELDQFDVRLGFQMSAHKKTVGQLGHKEVERDARDKGVAELGCK